MQGTRVWSLVQEDPTCLRATKPVRHNYWARAPRACALQQKKPLQWEAPSMKSCTRSPLEKAHAQQRRPSAAKNRIKKKRISNTTEMSEMTMHNNLFPHSPHYYCTKMLSAYTSLWNLLFYLKTNLRFLYYVRVHFSTSLFLVAESTVLYECITNLPIQLPMAGYLGYFKFFTISDSEYFIFSKELSYCGILLYVVTYFLPMKLCFTFQMYYILSLWCIILKNTLIFFDIFCTLDSSFNRTDRIQ